MLTGAGFHILKRLECFWCQNFGGICYQPGPAWSVNFVSVLLCSNSGEHLILGLRKFLDLIIGWYKCFDLLGVIVASSSSWNGFWNLITSQYQYWFGISWFWLCEMADCIWIIFCIYWRKREWKINKNHTWRSRNKKQAIIFLSSSLNF